MFSDRDIFMDACDKAFFDILYEITQKIKAYPSHENQRFHLRKPPAMIHQLYREGMFHRLHLSVHEQARRCVRFWMCPLGTVEALVMPDGYPPGTVSEECFIVPPRNNRTVALGVDILANRGFIQ